MFHWICPECGREIAPTVRECPVCDPVAATVETALAGVVEAPARAPKEPAAPARTTEPPPPEIQVQASVIVPGPPVIPDIHPAPALAQQMEPVSPLPSQGSREIREMQAPEAPLPQFGDPAEGSDPLDQLAAMLDSMEPEPPPSWEIIPLTFCGMPTAPSAPRAFIADLGPAEAKANAPLKPLQQVPAAPESLRAASRVPMAPGLLRQCATQPLGAKLLALPGPPLAPTRPNTPALDLAPFLAPLGKYSPLEGHPLRPALPEKQLLKKDYGPRTTLPGPMLTRRLVKFLDRELSAVPPEMMRARKRLIPGWMASALIIGTLLGAGFTSVVSLVHPTAAETQNTPTEAAAPEAAPSVSASPLVKAIEVTGFRIQMDPAKKSEIQYLVVNHTPSPFNGMTVYVTLYAANAKAGQPPLCKFQFAAPNLAPYQSKDMTSSIEQVTRPVTLPDWQELRAVVEIGQ